MIKTITALTHEIDEPEIAVQEIIEQLDSGKDLLSNSVGIISCFCEYIDAGIVKDLSSKLDFPIIGTTTMANAAGNEFGDDMLSLTVLTSDDVSFSVGLTEPINSDDISVIEDGYKKAMGAFDDKPSLIFAFAPLSQVVGGDFMVDALDKVSGGVPVFGTITVDHNPDYRYAAAILNGETYKEEMALLLFHGEVHPKFVVASISDEVIMRSNDVVTASKGNQLQKVNDMSVVDYLTDLGMKKNKDGIIEGINSIPFVVDYGDGSQPVIRILFALTEDGSAVCGGDIPEGTKLSVGTINQNEVMSTTAKAIDFIKTNVDNNNCFIFTCVGRFFALGYESQAELELITDNLSDTIPYALAYSGGEICPTYDENGKLYNRFHNDSFVACLF